ncbi:putative CoA-transferase [Mycobacterium antarcticum]|uniref:CoA transferase n=1 Tax=unclassified Mycolicibacterium TaxID=2636767 RepID=UPI00238C9FD3|nr:MULTISPECIES: CoA transferase [unclassified Mycolicibacterium]BDX32105.1 putative CoA-transferase [Mycolicibacterium sp. TUM20985]GLP75409.1 putative CoA-transferase [Mycolicibacterium sp. TUM20983]GLP84327.1 putative CoA-transferase [Mycolicibacterium sp. TUM20984]
MLDTCQLLASVRVLDTGGPDSDGVSRLLADLGADVLKVEAPGGAAHRTARPTVAGASVAFALDNANKRSAVLDPHEAGDRDRFVELVARADILVDGGGPVGAVSFGRSAAELADRFDHLVALEITDFGTSGPRADWRATDAVLYAMSTALSRSGPTAGRPVLPPNGIASGTAAVQGAWVALVAYYHRLRCGRGDYIDFSRFEAVVQCLDPPFGSEGQAAVGQKSSGELWRGRPRNQQIYPTFPCRDGFVRICLLSARQWRGMRAWLGEPEQFSDAKFESIGARYAASSELNAVIADLFADQTMDALVAEGQRRGVPIAAVLSPAQALASDHFRDVGALTEARVSPDATLEMLAGPFVIDGRRAGLERPCPDPGADDGRWLDVERPSAPAAHAPGGQPFEELRVLDLGVIVAGGELGRLFADLGAEVIKVESATYPDGLRQTPPGQPMSRSWALTHRNESSLGLDLRHPQGAAMFSRLVSESDAVFANFKPGTLAALGFSFGELRALNPGIILAESSAFGATGPWSGRMGYGPLVRATTGVSRLWTSDDANDVGFYDATTIFPDHVVARITAIGALAALIARSTSGAGAHVHVSQAEAAVNQLATTYAADAARAAGLDVADDAAVHAVYPCAGDDEWCVISVRSDDDRVALAKVMGAVELRGERASLLEQLAEWTSTRDKAEVAAAAQDAGVPAGPMNRAVDVLADPQLTFRHLYGDMAHPLFAAPLTAETHPAPFRRIADAPQRPAPMPGEQTREIVGAVLDLDSDDIDRLITEGVLFAWSGPDDRSTS